MSAVTQSGSQATTAAASETTKPASPTPVSHQEPQLGGSYTRNLSTGEIVKNERAGSQPDKE